MMAEDVQHLSAPQKNRGRTHYYWDVRNINKLIIMLLVVDRPCKVRVCVIWQSVAMPIGNNNVFEVHGGIGFLLIATLNACCILLYAVRFLYTNLKGSNNGSTVQRRLVCGEIYDAAR